MQNCSCLSSYLPSYLYPHHLELISFLSFEPVAAQQRTIYHPALGVTKLLLQSSLTIMI